MPSTIRNPIEWLAEQLGGTFDYIESAGESLGSTGEDAPEQLPRIRRIAIADLREALRKGIEDFQACRSDVIVIALIYPIIGFFITWLGFQRNLIPLIFPAIAGFALIGPVAAVGMYEISRRRERGEQGSWADLFKVVSSPSFGAILALGVVLLAIFGVWMLAAQGIYNATLGPGAPESLGAFIVGVLTTGAGWAMIIVGFGVGFLFAALVLTISVISFPLLLDRPVGLPAAVITSLRVAALNPRPIAAWGLIVAGTLALGIIPLFLGLIIVLPVLGHATWHLYRRAVA